MASAHAAAAPCPALRGRTARPCPAPPTAPQQGRASARRTCLLGDDAAADHKHMLHARRLQLSQQLGHQRAVPRRLAGLTHHVHVCGGVRRGVGRWAGGCRQACTGSSRVQHLEASGNPHTRAAAPGRSPASTACCATSLGVMNSGPMSTSKPRSASLAQQARQGQQEQRELRAKEHAPAAAAPTCCLIPCLLPAAHPVAMTLAPRSCPSCPILAMRMRGRRPATASNRATARSTASSSAWQQGVVARRPGVRGAAA